MADNDENGSVSDRLELIRRVFTDHVGFDLRLDRQVYHEADPTLTDTSPLPMPRLFDVHIVEKRLCLYPVSTLPTSRFLRPKYNRVRSICVDFDGYEEELTEQADPVGLLLEHLPQGFVKDPAFGLGLIKETRPIITAIEEIPGVEHLYISREVETKVDGKTYFLNSADYEELRLAFHRIAVRYQGESLQDRTLLAQNELLHSVLPEQFARKERPYKPGTIFKMFGGRSASTAKLRGKDRKGAIDVVTANAKEIESNDPKEFLQLQKDIELVSLDKLIEKYRLALDRNRGEGEWQSLFELNPFILSMVFGYPVVLVSAGASVGGLTFLGNGEKIADFLMKSSSTNNAALVEIKKPGAKLLGQEYRSGVWMPSKDLAGAVVQVLDQRLKLVTNIAQLRHASRGLDIEANAVDCVVVIGRTPTGGPEASSFELIRNQFKDVRVVTFDELLQKLILLRELLSGERYEPPPLPDDEEESIIGSAVDLDDDIEDL